MLHPGPGSWSAVRAFRLDAAAARDLAATFGHRVARDLSAFAEALERDVEAFDRASLKGASRPTE
jgi:hypothetical protein